MMTRIYISSCVLTTCLNAFQSSTRDSEPPAGTVTFTVRMVSVIGNAYANSRVTTTSSEEVFWKSNCGVFASTAINSRIAATSSLVITFQSVSASSTSKAALLIEMVSNSISPSSIGSKGSGTIRSAVSKSEVVPCRLIYITLSGNSRNSAYCLEMV